MHNSNSVLGRLKFGRSASAAAIVVALRASYMSAQAQQLAAPTQKVESVTVQGFKNSLERALEAKRSSANVSDSIEAEDIAKFPDLNLSEAIQRIPGVAISRDAGEGLLTARR